MAFPALLATTDGAVLQLLGGPVNYAPMTVGVGVDVVGIFDAAHETADVSDALVTTAVPSVFLRMADIAPNDPATDPNPTVVVDDKTYRVREAQKDGQGGVLLLLQDQVP